MTTTRRLLQLCLVLALSPLALLAADSALHLEIGDPQRSGKEVPLVLDAVTDARSGDLLTPSQLAERLAPYSVVFVGESHTDINFHRAQLRLIEELHRAGRKVLIGLEMYPYTKQQFLTDWVDGNYTEKGFLEASDWWESWGYNWPYYADIFRFARQNSLPMYAVNTPREVVKAVREKGFDNLSEEEAEHIPSRIDVENEEHFRLFKAFFEDQEDTFHAMLSDEQWRGMFRAQCTWDATMGFNAVQSLRQHEDPEAVMVVLIGAGHVAYGLGIQRQAAHFFDGRMAAVIPIPLEDDEGERIETVSAAYADFIWGMPAATDPIYPVLGLSGRTVEEGEGRKVIHVAESSPAEAAGFELGDILLTMDSLPIRTKGDVSRRMAEKAWGDRAVATVLRGEETLELEIFFRRQVEEDEDEGDEAEEGEGDDAAAMAMGMSADGGGV